MTRLTAGLLLFAAAALLAPRAASTQELEAFDLADFLDPWSLGWDGSEPAPRTFVSRLTCGLINNYQRRDEVFTRSGFLFVRVANSYYFGRNQLNFKLTGLGNLRSTDRDENVYDARLQFGRYDYDPTDPEDVPSRWMFSWRARKAADAGVDHEVSAILDVKVWEPGKLPGFVTLVYTHGMGKGDHSFSIVSRASRTLGRRGVFESALSVGARFAERELGFAPPRAELALVWPLPPFNTYFRVAYAAAYQPNLPEGMSGIDRVNHEVSLFVDTGLFLRRLRSAAD